MIHTCSGGLDLENMGSFFKVYKSALFSSVCYFGMLAETESCCSATLTVSAYFSSLLIRKFFVSLINSG